MKPCGARWATWAGAAVSDPARKRVLVSYGLIYAEPGEFNFRGVGASIAVWDDWMQQARRPTLGYCPDHPTMLFCDGEGDWAGTLVVDGDNLYGFSCENAGLSSNCQLARAPLADPLDRSQWQVWNGSAFESSFAAAATLFEGGLNMRVHYNVYARAWMAIYSKIVSNEVAYRTAPSLTGPWSSEETLFVADQKHPEGVTYDAYVQPDYSEEDGRVLYVTYSRSIGTWFGSELSLTQVTLH